MSLQDILYAYNIGKKLQQKTTPLFPPANGDTGEAFRPPQWSGLPVDDEKQLIYIKTNIGGWFFDAVMREEHTTKIKMTEHPVQTGANIVDHAYMEPATLTMEIAMSDCMATMVKGQFTKGPTKSVSAYQLLLSLQQARLPYQVHTRLNLYKNMLIEEITAPDDYKTQFGMRCTVTLKEIFVVEVSTTTVSARPIALGKSNRGVQQAEDAGTLLGQYDPNGMTGGKN